MDRDPKDDMTEELHEVIAGTKSSHKVLDHGTQGTQVDTSQ
jgi:hypothetical protein